MNIKRHKSFSFLIVLFCLCFINSSYAATKTITKIQRNNDRIKLELIMDRTSSVESFKLSIAQAGQSNFKVFQKGKRLKNNHIDALLVDFDKNGSWDLLTFNLDPEAGYTNGEAIVWLWDEKSHTFYKFYSGLASELSEGTFEMNDNHIVSVYARGCCDLTYSLTPVLKQGERLSVKEDQTVYIDTRLVNRSEITKEIDTSQTPDVIICNFRNNDHPIKPIIKWVKEYCSSDPKQPIYYEINDGYQLWR